MSRPSIHLLAAGLLLTAGCLGPRVLADRSLAHRVKPATVAGYCADPAHPDGQHLIECKVVLVDGDVCVAQELWGQPPQTP